MKNLSTIPQMKRMFAVVLLLVMGFTFSKSTAQCVTPPPGLVSWWRGEDDATDFIGNNHGALINGATFATGKVGQAFSFDGVDDGINVQKSGSFDFGANDFSIGAWVNFTEDFPGPDAAGIFLNYAGLPFYGLFINPNGEIPNVYFRDGLGNEVRAEGTTPLNDGNWHYLVGIRDGQNGYLYVDGTLVASASNPSIGTITTSSCTYARIGAAMTGPGHCTSTSAPGAHFKGLIDEVEIYNLALTGAEVQSIYNAGSAGKCTNTPPPVCVNPPSGLLSWWPGDDNANDIKGNNHGTLQNGATFASGLVDQAFSFDGVYDNVSIGNLGVFPTEGTFDFWMKPNTVQNYRNPLTTNFDGRNAGIRFEQHAVDPLSYPGTTNGFLVYIGNGAFSYANHRYMAAEAPYNNPIQPNTWYHVALVWNSALNNVKGYLNGVLVFDESHTLWPAALPNLTIGSGFSTASERQWDGHVDEVAIYDRALSASEIQSIYNAGSAGKCTNTPPPVCVTPPSGLISWWPGDDNANDIQDGNDGALQNGATFASGLVDQAFSFDGVDDFVRIEDNSNLHLGMGDLTVDAWIKTPPVFEAQSIIGKEQQSFPFPSILLRLTDQGKLQFAVTDCGTGACGFSGPGGGGSRQPVESPFRVDDDIFHHVAGVRHSSGYKLYVDGQLVATRLEPARNSDNTVPLFIGIQAISTTSSIIFPFQGVIDEAEIFNRALTAQEIADIYNAGSAGKCKECTPPEVSITGNDAVFTGTTHTYTATTDATNPSFEWSVTGGIIDGSNSNSSVSITAGAVGAMMVSVNVTDGVTNCSKEETKNVAVNPPPAGGNEVVFATNSVWLKEHAKILSGNVVVNHASSGPMLDSQVELSVGQSVTTPAGFALKAHRMKVKQGAVVASDIFYNELSNNGSINGSQNSPLTLPVFASLPSFHQAPAGTQDITVNQNESITLTAGAYRDLFIKQNGTILFTGGGSFALRSLNTGARAKLLFDTPTEILLESKLDTDENSYVGPQEGSGIGAADIVFYIAGSNGNNGNFGATPKAAQLGLKNTVFANFYVPNGTLWLRQGTVATGAFLGRDVIVGEQVQVTLESAFDGGSSLAKSANNESGEEKHFSTAIPEAFALLQNYPNPFNPSTVISFQLPVDSEVSLAIYNLSGQVVKQVASGEFASGTHSVVWDATDETGMRVASGVYVYVLRAGEFVAQRKLVLMK